MKIRFAVCAVLSFAVATLWGCSTVQTRVLPMEDGTNELIATDYERDELESEAVKAAEKYCKERKKEVVFVSQSGAEYKGKMKEETRDMVRKGSKAAMILSGPAGVVGDSPGVGGVLGSAGLIGIMSTNNRDYQAKLKFRCR